MWFMIKCFPITLSCDHIMLICMLAAMLTHWISWWIIHEWFSLLFTASQGCLCRCRLFILFVIKRIDLLTEHLSIHLITLSAAAGGGDRHSWEVQCHSWHRDQPAGHKRQHPQVHVPVLHRQGPWELPWRLQRSVCNSESIKIKLCFHPTWVII